jgi:hypothetical protein
MPLPCYRSVKLKAKAFAGWGLLKVAEVVKIDVA